MQEGNTPEHIYSSSGEPFKTQGAASMVMRQKNLNHHEVIQIPGEDGWIIMRLKDDPPPYVETYWWVTFNAKGSPNDPDDVILAVNAEILQVQREKRIIIPNRFKENADHATYPQFRQLPGEERKIVAQIKQYPYTTHEQATEAEYEEFKRQSFAKHQENLLRYGTGVNPADIGA